MAIRQMKTGRRTNSPNNFWLGVNKAGPDECWPWTRHLTSRGYGETTFSYRHVLAHRMAWTLTNGEIPDGLFVCHRCDNPPCCNPAHLFLGTNSDNQIDSSRKGRKPSQRGARNASSKLTDATAREIADLAGQMTGRSLAQKFSVSEATVSAIVNKKRWVQS